MLGRTIAGNSGSFLHLFRSQPLCASGCWKESLGGIYDPAFGLGSFYFAARELNPTIAFSGNDADDKILNFFTAHADRDSQLLLTHQDYLLSWGQRHQRHCLQSALYAIPKVYK